MHFIENPELVKPITTIIDNKKLSVEFIMPEIVALQRKTSLELEAEETIPLINKVNYFLIYINIYILNYFIKQYTNLLIIIFLVNFYCKGINFKYNNYSTNNFPSYEE